MVMSKVSKAIAASFLCLLFNAGGNVTNAMQQCCTSPNDSFSKEEFPNIDISNNNNRNNATPMGGVKVNDTKKVEIKEKIEEKIEEKEEKKEGEDGKKIPWNIILPIITGVGGLAGGILVGKFVF